MMTSAAPRLPRKQAALDASYGICRRVDRVGGQPTLGGTRLACRAILSFVMQDGGSVEAALYAYPYITSEAVYRVIAWALQTPERWR